METDMKHARLLIVVVLFAGAATAASDTIAAEPLQISGIYPHLTVYNGKHDPKLETWQGTGGECGIGAVVPWAGKLYLITYSPHCPNGSNDKLWTIDERLNIEYRPESVGGTPAGRMIHKESNQLLIGPYLIDAKGGIRVIPPKVMPGRLTAISRHLTDPANRVYYFDMEGAIYEADVNTLKVKRLFAKPVPGWHGKGGYTGQGRYIIANNGERRGHKMNSLLVGGPPQHPDELGSLCQWDGKTWAIVERKQFCDVTGPGGIYGSPDETSPVWAIGWDRRSVILKLLDGGRWHTFRMPKASHTYDHWGGWYTEWPRIREIAPGKLMMDMHGMFYDFPKTFCAKNTAGIRPIATHLRYIPDFCHWNGRVILASDDTAIVGGNKMAGRSQSNLWFGKVEDLYRFGPRNAWGGPWVGDEVKAGQSSEPFMMGGFDRRVLHLSTGSADLADPSSSIRRCSDKFAVTERPPELAGLARVTIGRGDFHDPTPGYSFTVNQEVIVYMAVDDRGDPSVPDGWEKTGMTMKWGEYSDTVYKRQFPKGRVAIPGHDTPHSQDAYNLPNMCFVRAASDANPLAITDLPKNKMAQVVVPERASANVTKAEAGSDGEVTFTLEIDPDGDGRWKKYDAITVPPGGYRYHIFPKELKAEWIQITPDKDCTATAYFHFNAAGYDPKDDGLFDSLAEVDGSYGRQTVGAGVAAGLIRPAGHNLSLQYLAQTMGGDGQLRETYYELDQNLAFHKPTEDRSDEVKKIAKVTKDFEVDDASVIMLHKGRRYRLPKGDSRYDKPFAAGWPRGIRECVSERYLMNIHGTIYQKPREGGLPKIKPIATHDRQIMDFCTWRGLMVISGTRRSAKPDGQYFAAKDGPGLWFGSIDDLWRLGKPVGVGGPWRKTAVKAGTASDPYLMTGYDKKTVELSHDAAEAVTFTIEVDVAHAGFHTYQTVTVEPGEAVTHEFPEGYSAHWVRLRTDRDCTAEAWFAYQ